MKVFRLITLLSALTLLPALVFADQAFVITKQNAVRQSCRFFAPVKASVSYNDLLDIVSTEGDWFKVRYRGVEGCIHKSAIQKKTASFTGAPVSGRSGGSVSQGETAMAGKGFNPQVEASYKGKHPEMRYDLVDKIEGYPVPDKELVRFITIGGLIEP